MRRIMKLDFDYDLQVKRANAIQQLLNDNTDLPPQVEAMWLQKLHGIAVNETELYNNLARINDKLYA